MYENCLHLLFHLLEEHDALDSENELHILALHFVFMPRIQRSLQEFQDAWNTHGLSSAQSSSPLQMWTSGMLRNRSLYTRVDEVFNVTNGHVEDDSDPEEESSSNLSIASSSNSNEDDDIDDVYRILRQIINPLDESLAYGVDLYANTLRIVLSHYSH